MNIIACFSFFLKKLFSDEILFDDNIVFAIWVDSILYGSDAFYRNKVCMKKKVSTWKRSATSTTKTASVTKSFVVLVFGFKKNGHSRCIINHERTQWHIQCYQKNILRFLGMDEQYISKWKKYFWFLLVHYWLIHRSRADRM